MKNMPKTHPIDCVVYNDGPNRHPRRIPPPAHRIPPPAHLIPPPAHRIAPPRHLLHCHR